MPENYTHWNEWNLPDEKQLKAFVHLVTPHIKWLAPAIVKAIADFNELHRSEWKEQLKSVGVSAEPYLWERSPCAFPGIRRHSSGDEPVAYKDAKRIPKEAAQLKKEAKAINKKANWQPSSPLHLPEVYYQNECLVTDDNSYPYQLWCYVVKGVKGGEDPRDYGFHLAHLFPHNDHNLKQLRDNADISGDHWLEGWPEILPEYGFSGLYSSAANLCFIPAELMRPTDLNGPLRRLMLQKAHHLYGKACNMFPHDLRELLTQTDTSHWHHKDFEWDDRHIGDLKKVESFNNYRANEFAKLITKKRLALTRKKEI